MKIRVPVCHVVILCLLSLPEKLQAQGTAFTYQGQLNNSGAAAHGNFDLRFALFDAASGGAPQGGALTNSATAVSNGHFTVTLDFGNQFPGANRWLEISVRTNGGGAFLTLTPRQPITPSPYAIHAGGVEATAIGGTYGNAVSFPNAGNSFAGDGSGLAALNASALAAGTVNDALLPPTISSDITGHAATADHVTGADTNTGKVFAVSDPANFKNSRAVLDRGGLYVASLSQGDQSTNVNWRGGIHFMDQNWDGTVGNTEIHGPQMAAIQVYSNWTTMASNPKPTMHIWSKGTIRIENGFNNATAYGQPENYLSLGNEDSNGRIYIESANGSVRADHISAPNAPNRAGFSLPLLFMSFATDEATNLRVSYPALQGFGTTNGGVSAGGWGTIYPGELAFWTIPPPANTSNANYGTEFPVQRAAGWMRTNGWQFFGRQMGSHRTITASTNTITLDFMGDYAQTITLSQATNTFTAINVNSYRGATNYEAKIFRIKAGPTITYMEWPANWTVVSPSGTTTLPTSLLPSAALRLQLEAFGDELMASYSLGAAN